MKESRTPSVKGRRLDNDVGDDSEDTVQGVDTRANPVRSLMRRIVG
jgi:hypothetical protein